MTVGTKSVLFGYHAFWLHGWTVAAAWAKLYGFPFDPRLWAAFFLHDVGYLGMPNMDGKEGKQHPRLGASLLATLCGEYVTKTGTWYNFSLYHSRSLAKQDGVGFSQLCVADKLAVFYYPDWLLLILYRLSGEGAEYLENDKKNSGETIGLSTWISKYKAKTKKWVAENRDKYDAA